MNQVEKAGVVDKWTTRLLRRHSNQLSMEEVRTLAFEIDNAIAEASSKSRIAEANNILLRFSSTREPSIISAWFTAKKIIKERIAELAIEIRSPASKVLKLQDIAEKISAHLKRFERDQETNRPDGNKLHPFFLARAYTGGSRVFVIYVNYQGASSLTKSEAEAYLNWLDAGNVGKHFLMERNAKKS